MDDESIGVDGDEEDWDLAFTTFVSHEEVAQTQAALSAHAIDLATVAGFAPEEMDALYARGLELLRIGMYHDAGRLFHGLIQLKPTEGRYYRNLGLAMQYEGLHTWARIAYRQALAFDPEDRIAMALRAECTLIVQGKREALPELEKVVALGARTRSDEPYIARANALLAKMTVYRMEVPPQ